MNGERLVPQPGSTAQRDAFHKLFAGNSVQAATTMNRINKRVKSDMGDAPRPACCNIAEQLSDNTLWKVIGLDFASQGKGSQAWCQAPMPANHAFQ